MKPVLWWHKSAKFANERCRITLEAPRENQYSQKIQLKLIMGALSYRTKVPLTASHH